MRRTRPDLILAVDGGRTHLRAHVVTVDGGEIASIREGGINPLMATWREVAERLAGIARRTLIEPGVESSGIGVAVVGLAGLDREEDQKELKASIESEGFPFPWLLESDARQTLRAADPAGAAAIGLLGTGSAFFARDPEGRIWRAGGWGPLLRDWGSGFELARQGFIAVCRAHDGTGPDTTLTSPLLEMVGVGSPPEFLRVLYTDAFQPAFWARFAPLVLREAERGDRVAEEIFAGQVAGVAETCSALMAKAAFPMGARFFFSGGLVKGSEFYFKRLVEAMEKHLPHHPCRLLDREAFWGGWEWARRFLRPEEKGCF